MAGEDLGRRVDLDGLQVFDAVMREGNVSRAADRLALTQSAVSHALARLRIIFKDPLFIRAAGGVKPTPRAVNLWSEVQDALQVLKRAVQPGEFAPAKAQFNVTMAVNDMVLQQVLPPWLGKIRALAPNLRLSLVMRKVGDTESRLVQGALDFGIGLFYSLPPALHRIELWSDRYVCLFRRDHPLAKRPWNVATFQAFPQVAVSPDGDLFTYADGALRYAGIERNIGMLVGHFSSVPPVLASTDLCAMLPEFYAAAIADEFSLIMRPPPFPLQPVKYELVWHERIDRLQSHVWFREHIVASISRPASTLKQVRQARPGSKVTKRR